MKINSNKKAGFTLVEIMIVVAIIGLLAAIAIPNFVRARTTSQKNACINNLRQIDGAKQQWALELGKTNTDTPSWKDLTPYLGRGDGDLSSLRCQSGGLYRIGKVGAAPTCSIGAPSHVLN